MKIFLLLYNFIRSLLSFNHQNFKNEDKRKGVKPRMQQPDEPTYKARNLMTEREAKFFHYLVSVFPECYVMSQVQLWRLLGSDDLVDNNRINRLSLDFVLLRQNLSTYVIIELDDRSHHREQQKERDTKKDKALQSAGLRVARVSVMPKDLDEAKVLRYKITAKYPL